MCAQRALPDKDELLVTGQLRLEVEGLGVGVDGSALRTCSTPEARFLSISELSAPWWRKVFGSSSLSRRDSAYAVWPPLALTCSKLLSVICTSATRPVALLTMLRLER